MVGKFWSHSGRSSSLFTGAYSHLISFQQNENCVLHRYEYRDLLRFNIDVAIFRALQEISVSDLCGFYEQVGYFNRL